MHDPVIRFEIASGILYNDFSKSLVISGGRNIPELEALFFEKYEKLAAIDNDSLTMSKLVRVEAEYLVEANQILGISDEVSDDLKL